MIVTGLNGNRFLTGNPIPVTFAPDTQDFLSGSKIILTVTKLATHSGDVAYTYPPVTLYPSPKGITIDLAPYIKGLMPIPYVPDSSYQNPIPNYQRFTITAEETQGNTSQVFSNKTFIRGFRRTKSNQGITLPVGTTLNNADRIPIWGSYPTARFFIDSNNTIQSTTVVDSQYTKRMRMPTACNPFYVRFLNSLGGYSFWMFNAWEWETSSDAVGVIKTTTNINNRSLGFAEQNTVTVDTRVKREFYGLMRDLVVSPVVQVYNEFDMEWLKIELQGSSFSTSNYEDLQEPTFTFDLMLNTNPQTVW